MRNSLWVIGIGIIILILSIKIADGIITNEIEVRVEKLVNQQLIRGSGQDIKTDIRYLVITDNGTYVCESALLKMKFNNSDIFFHLVVGKWYKLKVVGFGKSFITDYQNIVSASVIDGGKGINKN